MKRYNLFFVAILFISFAGLANAFQQEAKRKIDNSTVKAVKGVKLEIKKDSKCCEGKDKMDCKAEAKKDLK